MARPTATKTNMNNSSAVSIELGFGRAPKVVITVQNSAPPRILTAALQHFLFAHVMPPIAFKAACAHAAVIRQSVGIVGTSNSPARASKVAITTQGSVDAGAVEVVLLQEN